MVQVQDQNQDQEKFNVEGTVFEFINGIRSIINERDRLREENETLKQRIEQLESWRDKMISENQRYSDLITESILDGSIVVNKNK